MGLVASFDSMDAILEWRYVVDGSATYFAAADGEAVFSAIERYVDEHGDLPWFVVVDQVAYELRWHSVTHPKKPPTPSAVGHQSDSMALEGEACFEMSETLRIVGLSKPEPCITLNHCRVRNIRRQRVEILGFILSREGF